MNTIDARRWMQALRLEYYRVAALRQLRVGERLWVAYFKGPGVNEEVEGHCEAYFERVKGKCCYHFFAVWTVQWTEKTSRSHVVTSGAFELLPGNTIRFQSERDELAEQSFRRVCRYAQYIDRHARDYGFERRQGAPYHRHTLWRGETVLKNGRTKRGVEGPVPMGRRAVVEAAIALGVVPCETD